MNNKIKLQLIAREINELLLEYIVVDNTLQKKSNSFLSIFKPIDFGKLSKQTQNILVRLKDKGQEVDNLKNQVETTIKKEFINCLSGYTNALIKTVELLLKMLDDLLMKSKGSRLSMKEHFLNSRRYKESINKYMSFGKKLNTLYREL